MTSVRDVHTALKIKTESRSLRFRTHKRANHSHENTPDGHFFIAFWNDYGKRSGRPQCNVSVYPRGDVGHMCQITNECLEETHQYNDAVDGVLTVCLECRGRPRGQAS